MEAREIMEHALFLDADLKNYHSADTTPEYKKEIKEHYLMIWGDVAHHILGEYASAENLLWKLDNKLVNLFLEKYKANQSK